MTKTKRVAVVAVAVVLAGTMAVGLTACGKKKDKSTHEAKAINMTYTSGTTLNTAIGYNSADTGMFFSEKAGASNTSIVGGYTMNAYSAKPATRAIMDALDIKLNDEYSGWGTSANLTNLVNDNSWNSTVDMATSDLSVAATEAAKGTVLNLADYLQYMPNFQKFLNDNPIVYLSLLQGGMDTDTGEGQALYVAPYFDGMDDIEKGVLMRHDWIESVLDAENAWATPGEADAQNDTFYTACYSASGVNAGTAGTQTYATSYMGTTGSWTIVSTAEGDKNTENDGSETITIKKDYSAALDAFRDTRSEQARAYAAVAGNDATYGGDSGNIVDIMNAAINEDLRTSSKNGASGENLANLYKAYIDAAYTADTDGDGEFETYYGNGGVAYSKVFTGYSGCWDVDDLTALLRIIKCSSGQVGLSAGIKTVGIFPRTYDNGRTPDLVSLVGELYGCRGATSRYEQTYIDSDGVLQDARNDKKFWDSLVAFGGLCSEGLVEGGYILNGQYNDTPGTYTNDLHGQNENNTMGKEGFMQWDYSQTQTTVEFTNDSIEYGWVNTPVSLWDDGTKNNTKVESANEYGYSYNASTGEKYMRFTDSWRSTKTAGLVIAANVENDENELAAALSFVDYLYSNDGRITTTYAIQSTNGDTNPNGTWYGTEVEDLSSVDGALASESGNNADDGANYKVLCDETYQWVIKEEYRDKYVMWNGLICNKDKTPGTLDEYDTEGNLVNSEDISTQYETYADKVSYYTVKEEYQGKCFTYGGKIYTGTLYKGKMTPTITTELYEHFTAADSPENAAYSARGSFTDFARKVLGSTLPICVKDQSFENQMTAEYAKECATVVGVSIGNGTINHCELNMTDWNYFYTCIPTGFPLETRDQNGLDATTQQQLKYLSGSGYGGTSEFYSIYIHVMWYGYTGTYVQNQVNVNFSTISSASSMISYFNSNRLDTRIDILRTGWENAVAYWGYLGSL